MVMERSILIKYSIDEIQKTLNIGRPLLLVDSVIIKDNSVIGNKYVDEKDFFFDIHFLDGEKIMPGTLQLEAMTQTATLGLMKKEKLDKIPIVVAINEVRFYKKIMPGNSLNIYVVYGEEKHGMVEAIAKCEIQSDVVCVAKFKYVINR